MLSRATTSRRALAAAAGLCALVLAASSSAGAASPKGGVRLQPAIPVGAEQPPPQAEPAAPAPDVSPAQAEEVLDAAEAALAGEPGAGDATAALGEVAEILPALHGEDHRRGESMLARPTDGPNDPSGDGYTVAPVFSAASTNFCYFWVTTGPDAVPLTDANANGVPDYIEVLAASAENAFAVENGQLGWRRPPSDGSLGCDPGDGRSRIDYYTKELPGLYGYVSPDPGQQGKRLFSYLVIDNDMVGLGYSSFVPPIQVTAAHEYNHVIQFGYDANQDQWMFESTATWMEEIVYPAVNDYLQYLGDFARRVTVPLTKGGANEFKIYASAVWNHFLTHQFGPAVVRDAWAASLETNPQEFAVAAFDRAIRATSKGRSTFGKEFARFAAATAEWRSTSVFPDSTVYPDVRRSGTIRTSDRFYKRLVLDHTTFRLLNVPERNGKAVKLQIFAPRGIGAGLALVGRIGNGAGATVITVAKALSNGGKGVVRLANPRRFSRISAVVVNGDFGVRGFSAARGDWLYSGNNARFDVGTFLIR